MAHAGVMDSHGVIVAVGDSAVRLDGQVAAFELISGLEAMNCISECSTQLRLTVGKAAWVSVFSCPAVC